MVIPKGMRPFHKGKGIEYSEFVEGSPCAELLVGEFLPQLSRNDSNIVEAPGRARLAKATALTIYDAMSRGGIRHPFVASLRHNFILVRRVNPIPLEVVLRIYGGIGSHGRRNPGFPCLGRIDPLKSAELYLKTTKKKFIGVTGRVIEVPVDDPLIRFTGTGSISLRRPSLPFADAESLINEGVVTFEDLGITPLHLAEMTSRMQQVARCMEDLLPRNAILVDLKCEFGFDAGGNLIVMDPITPGECRIILISSHPDHRDLCCFVDKELFRGIENIHEGARVATHGFALCNQLLHGEEASGSNEAARLFGTLRGLRAHGKLNRDKPVLFKITEDGGYEALT